MWSHFDAGLLPALFNRSVAKQLFEMLDEIGSLLCTELRLGSTIGPAYGSIAPLNTRARCALLEVAEHLAYEKR